MQNENECLQVASAFESRGMEFQKQEGSRTRPGTSRPATAMIESRPSSMQTNSPFFHLSPTQPPIRPDPFSRPTLEAGSLSSNGPNAFLCPASQDGGFHGHSQNPSLAMPPPKFFTRDENVVPREVEPNRPTTSHMYRASTALQPRSPLNKIDSELQTTTSAPKRQASASLASGCDSIRQQALDFEMQAREGFRQNSSYVNSHEGFDSGHMSSTGLNDQLSQPLADARSGSPMVGRTAIAAAAMSTLFDQNQQSHLSDVPFLRPENRSSSNLSATSRPMSSSLNLPPLPRPNSVKKSISPIKPNTSWNETRSNVLLPPTDASPSKRTFEVFSESNNAANEPRSSVNRVREANASLGKTSDHISSTASVPKPGPMDEFLARKRPLLQRSANAGVTRIDSTKDAPHEILSPPSTALLSAKVSQTTQPAPVTMNPQEHKNLNDYAAQSQEDRAAALDDFVVANLENPSFTTLCEDIENCWRRIALGL
jgi:hypothetical protein